MKRILSLFLTVCFCMSLSALDKFDPNEDCKDVKGQAFAAKQASVKACEWISSLGAGTKDDTSKAFGKINQARHCGNNYVWVQLYYPHETVKKDNYMDVPVMLVHPVKPALERSKELFHKGFHGYNIFEQFNVAGYNTMKKVKPEFEQGCWVPYKWTAPDSEKIVDKVSFITICKDKDSDRYLIAGAGIYSSKETLPDAEKNRVCSVDPMPYSK